MDFRKYSVIFWVGGGAYVGLELLYRRRSHVSMFLAGGSSFLFLGRLGKSRLPLWSKPVLGAAGITLVELITGLLVNKDHHVWDYRDQPGNYRGQICPGFSLLWIPLSAAGMYLYRQLDKCLP